MTTKEPLSNALQCSYTMQGYSCNGACLQDPSNTLSKPYDTTAEMELVDVRFRHVTDLLADVHQRLRIIENDYHKLLQTLESREEIHLKEIAALQQEMGKRILETYYVKEQVESMVKNGSTAADGEGYVLSSLDRVFGRKEIN